MDASDVGTASHAPLIDAAAARALSRLRMAHPDRAQRLARPEAVARLSRVAIASDFAIDTLVRQGALLDALLDDDGAQPPAEPVLSPEHRTDWPALLRRYRAAGSTRLVWRDVFGLDDVDATLAGSTHLAERCLQLALDALQADFAQRHGVVRDRDGNVQHLVVFGLGKLGGGELNFSSDVDLVYAYEHDGASDGARPLDAEHYFARLGQQLAKLLDELTVDGFCHRVDLRLRPYGNAGRVAWSFTAMEQYFQREGRDWERYAWQKARPVAGDIDAGERFLEALRPFVYRRYLDFGALDGLRSMKAAISAEVARKELADDIKRGPGGIREIEFLVQALQLIYGGREPSLRDRRLLPSLQALTDARQMTGEAGAALADAYRFLRLLENRLQMLRDAQTHALPESPDDRARIAVALDHDDWAALRTALDAQRAVVNAEFEALLAPRRKRNAPDALTAYWRALPEGGDSTVLADGRLRRGRQRRRAAARPGPQPRRARTVRQRTRAGSTASCRRCCKPPLRRANRCSRSSACSACCTTCCAAAHTWRCSTNNPWRWRGWSRWSRTARCWPNGWRRIRLLLDELLDARVAGPLPGRDELHAACAAVAEGEDDDAEAVLQALNEVRQALSFRIAMALRDGRQSAMESACQLAWLADGVVMRVLRLAEHEVAAAHGRVPDARFAVIGYGSLGGEELGFGSDLDLVFLYDAPGGEHAHSDGARPLEATRWFARVAQKVVALLGAVTGAGRLYDVDVRLRPDGAKGLLVSSLASYRDYQRERAWTWEHQALVRARFVAGDASLGHDFEAVRDPHAVAPARHPVGVRRRGGDAPAHARRTRPQRRGGIRPQAGRGRAGRPGIPAAVRRARALVAARGVAGAAQHARADRRHRRRRLARGGRSAGAHRRPCGAIGTRPGLHAGPAHAPVAHR